MFKLNQRKQSVDEMLLEDWEQLGKVCIHLHFPVAFASLVQKLFFNRSVNKCALKRNIELKN